MPATSREDKEAYKYDGELWPPSVNTMTPQGPLLPIVQASVPDSQDGFAIGFVGAGGQVGAVELEVLTTEVIVDVVLSEGGGELEVELVDESDDEADNDVEVVVIKVVLNEDEETALLAVWGEDEELVVQVLVREDEGASLQVPNPS